MQKRSIGTVMLIIGLLMMIYTGFTYVTKKKVVDLGPVEINKEEKHPVQWSPIVGAVLFVGGVILMVNGREKV